MILKLIQKLANISLSFEFPGASESTCKRKVWYRSQEKAERVREKMCANGTLDHEVEAYRCSHCDRWHLGGCQ